jgi:hypothetical protein
LGGHEGFVGKHADPSASFRSDKVTLPRILVYLLLSTGLVLGGCASSEFTQFTETVRQSFTGDQLNATEYFVSIEMEFISLQKGEIVGDDVFFKREIKKTHKIAENTPGKKIRAGDGWLTIEWPDSIFLTFARNPSTGVYQTPGWGTVTIQNERFDINLHVMAGRNVDLVVKR